MRSFLVHDQEYMLLATALELVAEQHVYCNDGIAIFLERAQGSVEYGRGNSPRAKQNSIGCREQYRYYATLRTNMMLLPVSARTILVVLV